MVVEIVLLCKWVFCCVSIVIVVVKVEKVEVVKVEKVDSVKVEMVEKFEKLVLKNDSVVVEVVFGSGEVVEVVLKVKVLCCSCVKKVDVDVFVELVVEVFVEVFVEVVVELVFKISGCGCCGV